MRRESHDLITGETLLPGVLQLFIAGIAGIASYHRAVLISRERCAIELSQSDTRRGITATQ